MVLDIYYQQRAAIFVAVFALFGHVKDAYFVHKRKKSFLPWLLEFWDVARVHNVHCAEVSLESWVMGNSSVKDPVKLCTSSSVMSGYSVLADTAISIYSTLKSGSSSYTHHSGVAMVHLLIVGRCTHA